MPPSDIPGGVIWKNGKPITVKVKPDVRVKEQFLETKKQFQDVLAEESKFTPESIQKLKQDFSKYEQDVQTFLKDWGEYEKDVEDWLQLKQEVARTKYLDDLFEPFEKGQEEFIEKAQEFGISWTEASKKWEQADGDWDKLTEQWTEARVKWENVEDLWEEERTRWEKFDESTVTGWLEARGKEYFERSRPTKFKESKFRDNPLDLRPDIIANFLGWGVSRVALGAVRAVPFVLAGTVGAIVAGPGGAIFVPVILAGLTLPKVTTIEMREQRQAYIREHPEFWADLVLQGLGGLALASGTSKLVSGARTRIQQQQLDKFYEMYPIEDFFVPEEVLAQYPESSSYYDVYKEIVDIPVNTRIVTDYTGDVATLVSKGYQKGLLYKLGEEYGLVLTGNDAVVMKLPVGVGEPTIVTRPTEISRVVAIVDEVPGIRFQLEELAGQGYHIPVWLGILGPGTKIGSEDITKELKRLGFSPTLIDRFLPQLKMVPNLTLNDINRLEGLRRFEDLQEELNELLNRRDVFQEFKPEAIERSIFITPDLQTFSIEEIGEIEEIEIPKLPQLTLPTLEIPMLEPSTPLEDFEGIPDKSLLRRGFEVEPSRIEVPKISISQIPEPYRVRFQYSTGSSEMKKVEARSFKEALTKAQKLRRINRTVIEVEVEKLRR